VARRDGQAAVRNLVAAVLPSAYTHTLTCQSRLCNQSTVLERWHHNPVRHEYRLPLAVDRQPDCWFGLDRMSAVANSPVLMESTVQ
jgi:hypothetical protein